MNPTSTEKPPSLSELLAQQGDLSNSLFKNSPAAILISGADMLTTAVNPAFTKMFGYTPGEIIGKNKDHLITSEENALEAAVNTRAVLQQGETIQASGVLRKKGGSPIDVDIHAFPIRQGGSITGIVSTYTDRTHQQETLDTLADFYKLFLYIMDNIEADIYAADMGTHTILFMNKHMKETHRGDFSGQLCWQALHSGLDEPCGHCTNHFLIGKDGKPTGEHVWEGKNPVNGRWFRHSDRAVRWMDGRFVRLEIATDITNQKENEERLHYLNTHDPLTNLPNRSLFDDRLGHALQMSQRSKSNAAVLYLDLDGFKVINDKLGRMIGDLILKRISERLMNVLRNTDTIARFSGDEYGVILEKVANPDDTLIIGEKVTRAISEPFFFEGTKVIITGSVGISIFPDHGKDSAQMIKAAEEAMREAKNKGKNRFQMAS